MAQHPRQQAWMKSRAEHSVICDSDGKHSLLLPLLGDFRRLRNTDSGSLPPLTEGGCLLCSSAPDGCCFITSISQRAALTFLGSRTGLSISPSLTPFPSIPSCVLSGVGPQTAPPHPLSKGVPLLDCGGGKGGSGGLPLTTYESPGQPCHHPCPDFLACKKRRLG